MNKLKMLLAIALAACFVVVAGVLFSQSTGADGVISQISEETGQQSDAFLEDGGELDFFEQGVPLGETAAEVDPFIAEVLRLVNVERSKKGAAPLTGAPHLNEAANVRAVELTSTFSHTRPDGSRCFTVFNELNISCNARAENIAAGYKTPQLVVQGWMKSEGHMKNILNPSYNNLGVGVCADSSGKLYWVQLFSD